MDAIHDYAQFLGKFLKPVRPLKVVFDSSDGTTGIVLEALLQSAKGKAPARTTEVIQSGRQRAKINAILLNAEPDGTFPAHGPNPWNEKTLAALGREVVRQKADCGVVFDADGDRVFFVDDLGHAVSADHTAILIGMAFKGPVVLDLRMGYGAREWFTARKRKVVDSRVGHFFIKKLMRAKHIPYAAELSGHYYFSFEEGSASGGEDIVCWDSGILAAIHMINQIAKLKTQNLTLSEWIDGQPKYWQSGEINFTLPTIPVSVIPAKAGIQKSKKRLDSRLRGNDNRKEKIMKHIEAQYRKRAKKISHLDGLKMEFETFWMNVRPSNTEDLLRLNLEAKEKEVFDREMGTIDKLIKSMLK